MTRPEHDRLVLARITREEPIEGMRPSVTLNLIHDDDAVEINEGDDFVSILMAVDPWESRR